MHYELPIGAFIAALLVLVPLPWHWRARNVATISIVAWLFTFNVIYGINAMIWAGNFRKVATVWCDIVTKLQIGGNIALPACCLALCIHLESIASLRHVQSTVNNKRRKLVIDIVLCWVLPLVYMGLHYIVQGHRFDIVEDFGCRPTTYNSIASIFLIWLPPMLCVVATLVLAGMCLFHFFRRRITFARHLQQSNTALTTSRYFRLIAMSIVQMFWGIAIMSIMMAFTLRSGLRPWTSWDDVHSDWLRIDVFPARFIPSQIMFWTHLMWWSIPISSLLFFIFFSFGEDAMKEYRQCITWLGDRTWKKFQLCGKSDKKKKLILPTTNISKPIPIPQEVARSKFLSLHFDKSEPLSLSFSSSTMCESTVYSPTSSKAMSSTDLRTPTTQTYRPESQFSLTTTETSGATIVDAESGQAPPKYYYHAY